MQGSCFSPQSCQSSQSFRLSRPSLIPGPVGAGSAAVTSAARVSSELFCPAKCSGSARGDFYTPYRALVARCELETLFTTRTPFIILSGRGATTPIWSHEVHEICMWPGASARQLSHEVGQLGMSNEIQLMHRGPSAKFYFTALDCE